MGIFSSTLELVEFASSSPERPKPRVGGQLLCRFAVRQGVRGHRRLGCYNASVHVRGRGRVRVQAEMARKVRVPISSGGERTKRHVWFVNHHALVPSKDGGAGRHFLLAQALPDEGWSASLIAASTSHYGTRQNISGRGRSLFLRDLGVPVSLARVRAHGSSLPGRALGMLDFCFSALLPSTTASLRRPDVVVGSTVHPLAAYAGFRLSRRHGTPFVFEVRDVWPDRLVDLGFLPPGGLGERLLRRLMLFLAKKADLVLSPLPHLDRWLGDNGISGKPFLWLSNGTDRVSSEPPPQRRLRSGAPFTFMYLGAQGNANALDDLMDAFDRARRLRPDLDLRLHFVGDGPRQKDFKEHAKTLASGHYITFEDRIPQAEVRAKAQEADCLVLAQHDSPAYRYGISMNKLFMYMGVGRPSLLATSASNNPIAEAEAGLSVRAGDQDALARAMCKMALLPAEERHAMASMGLSHARTHYTFEALAARLAVGLDSVL